MTRYDYRFARVIGGGEEFERVIDVDGPIDDMGRMGEPDALKLEFSGWVRDVEFKELDK